MDTPDKRFISNTNMLRGMFCFGVKCECVYSPLEEDMQHAMCSVQHMIQSATDTRSRGSASVQRSISSACSYMICSPVWSVLCVCRMVVGYVCSGVFQKEDLLSGTLLFSSLSSISLNDTYILDIMIQ